MNQLERDTLDKVKDMLKKTVENTDIRIDLEESKDEVIHAYFDNIGEYEGAFMTEVDFITPYKDRDVETLQIFSTLSADVDEELFPIVMEKLNELNATIIFGNFGLFPEGKQVFHRYVLPLPKDTKELNNINIKAAWEEIWSTLTYFLPYILVLSNEGDIMDIDDYMEAMNEAI